MLQRCSWTDALHQQELACPQELLPCRWITDRQVIGESVLKSKHMRAVLWAAEKKWAEGFCDIVCDDARLVPHLKALFRSASPRSP